MSHGKYREDPPPDPEASGRTLPANPELENALREAMESVESHAAARAAGAPGAVPAGSEGAGGEGAETGEDLAHELKQAQDRLLRLQADFENFRRRALAERRDIYQYGHENLVKDLLSTVDNLGRAISHAREDESTDLESFLQGVELVQRELIGALENHSVVEIEAIGKPFDPAVHEALAQLPDGSVAPNTVINVLQKGYQLRDRLLRPSRVIVAKLPEGGGGNGEKAAG